MNAIEERIPKLTGKAAEEFEAYDSRELTDKEIAELEEAKEFYLNHCCNNNDEV